jgi:hypothetical protein
VQKSAGIQGKRFFTLLLFCHVVASYWNQVVATRNIKNGQEILAAYGTEYAPRLRKNVAALEKDNKRRDRSGQQEIEEKCRIVQPLQQ